MQLVSYKNHNKYFNIPLLFCNKIIIAYLRLVRDNVSMAKPSDNHPVSALELFGKSYELVMRNIKTFGILLILPAIAAIASTARYDMHSDKSNVNNINFFSGTTPAYAITGIIGVSLISVIIFSIAALIIQAMLTCLQLEAAEGKTPTLKHLWQLGKKYWLRLLGLVLVIGMYIIGGSLIGVLVLIVLRNALGVVIGLSLIAAAILFVLVHYYLAPYALVEGDMKIFDALEKSANISKQFVWSVLSVIGIFFLIALIGELTLIGPIISFILGSLYSVAPALRYKELKRLAK